MQQIVNRHNKMRKKKTFGITKDVTKYTLTGFILCISFAINAQWMWNIEQLKEIRQKINTPDYAEAYKSLIDDANHALKKGPYSVTFKKGTAPSGDKHDYVSLARYVWPNPDKPDGLPYITRDGETNPELENYDRIPLGELANSVVTLSLAYFYSNEEQYAGKAVDLLRVWFINEDTRMNPHLTYAQFIPGVNNNKGRSYGLIDTYSFVDMLNSVQLLQSSGRYTEHDKQSLQKWFSELVEWWKTDPQAIAERNATNNHGLAYDMQLTTFALFAGDQKTADEVMDEFTEKRIYPQVEPDGKQPLELNRTLAFHYSVYNIRFMVDMCATAKSQQKELLRIESPDGRSLYKAVDFLIPYLGKSESDWPYQQINGWETTQQHLCDELLRIASIDSTRQDYYLLYRKYNQRGKADRNRLIYSIPSY